MKHDVSLLVQRLCGTVDTDGRADRINSRKLMPHNQNLILGYEQFTQRLCLDSRFDAGIVLLLLCLAAVELGAFRRADNRLIAAAAQAEINRHAGIFAVGRDRIAVHTGTDAERNSRLIADVQRLDILQQREAVFLYADQILLCKDKEELILVQLADDAAVSREILVQLALDQSSEKRLTNGFGTLHDFFVIVHVDQTENNLTVFDFRERFQMLRDVVHADRDERAFCFQVLHIHLVGNILEGKRLAAGLAGTGQTLGNFREDAADMLLIVLILRDGTECFIHPYEFAGN